MAGQEHCCEVTFWLYLLVIIGLVTFAGLMSGLTLGLMSLGLVDLEVLVKSGRPSDRKHAAKILPVVKNQHLLLCTLLIGNSLAMEALPIFLDSLVPSWGAVLISVTLILIFGEILPQAVCSRYGLKVGATMAPVVRLLLLIFFPVTYPISKLLDCLLGKGHFVLLRRAELKTLVDMHGNEAGKGGELTHDETTIITGALEMTQKTAKDAMTPICATFSVDVNAKLDVYTMNLIMTKGHSRVPVYSGIPTNIIGLILQLVSLKNREYEGLERLGRIGQLALEDRLVLVQSGLHRVAQSRHMVMDPSLLLEMLATWDTRTHAFHLPGGDLMITPRLVRRITGLPDHGAPAILDSGTRGAQDRQEAQEFFTGAAGRVTRRGIALSDILQSPVSELRKVIVLIIMHRISHSTNYYDIPYGWRRVVRQVEAGERLNWAALLARGMITRLDALAGKAHGNYPYCSILMCMLFDFFPRTAPRGPKRVLTIFEPLMNRWEMRWRRPGSHVERDVGGASVRELRVQDLVVDPYAGVVWPSDEENEEGPGPEVAGNSREEQANIDGPQGSAGREPTPPPQEESVELVDSDQEENDTEIACRLEGYFPGIERHRLLAGEPPVVEAGHAWERAAMARDVIRALEIENARLQGQNSVLQSQMSFVFERGLTGQIAEPIARGVRGAGGFQGMQQRSSQANRGEPFQGMPPPS